MLGDRGLPRVRGSVGFWCRLPRGPVGAGAALLGASVSVCQGLLPWYVQRDEMFIKLSPCFVFYNLRSERLVINSLLKRNPDLFLQAVTLQDGIKRFRRRPPFMLPLAV